MAKKTITRSEYLQLVGLFTLAEHHQSSMNDIEQSAAGILGAEGDGFGNYGHLSDAIFGVDPPDLQHALDQLDVEVIGEPTPPQTKAQEEG